MTGLLEYMALFGRLREKFGRELFIPEQDSYIEAWRSRGFSRSGIEFTIEHYKNWPSISEFVIDYAENKHKFSAGPKAPFSPKETRNALLAMAEKCEKDPDPDLAKGALMLRCAIMGLNKQGAEYIFGKSEDVLIREAMERYNRALTSYKSIREDFRAAEQSAMDSYDPHDMKNLAWAKQAMSTVTDFKRIALDMLYGHGTPQELENGFELDKVNLEF